MNASERIVLERNKQGISQERLAQLSGISLRTIQRIEKNAVVPRSYTLNVLLNTLNIPIGNIVSEDNENKHWSSEELGIMRLLNFSFLFFSFVPLLNIIPPVIIWYKNRHSPRISEFGGRVISAQLVLSIITLISLLAVPLLSFAIYGQGSVGKFPTPLLIYGLFLLASLALSFYVAINLGRGKEESFLLMPRIF